MNMVQIIGYLGRDPETRYVASGDAVTEFSVATSEKWKDRQSGEQKESTEWFSVVAWGRQAEVCGEYLRKGSRVYVQGKQQTDEWETDGTKHYRTKLRLERFEFLSPSTGGERAAAPSKDTSQQSIATDTDDGNFDDDIPF